MDFPHGQNTGKWPVSSQTQNSPLVWPEQRAHYLLLYFPVKEPPRLPSDSHPPLQQKPEELQVAMLNWLQFSLTEQGEGLGDHPFEKFMKLTN